MVMSVYTVLNDLIHFRQLRSMAGDDVLDLDMMAVTWNAPRGAAGVNSLLSNKLSHV